MGARFRSQESLRPKGFWIVDTVALGGTLVTSLMSLCLALGNAAGTLSNLVCIHLASEDIQGLKDAKSPQTLPKLLGRP